MGNHDNKVIAVSKNDYTVAHDIAAQRISNTSSAL